METNKWLKHFKARNSHRESKAARVVTARANIYKITSINPAEGYFEIDGYVEYVWQLSQGDVEKVLNDGLNDEPHVHKELALAAKLRDVLEKEATTGWRSTNDRLWSPHPYFINSFGVPIKHNILHEVTPPTSSSITGWRVTRTEQIICGRFQLTPLEQEEDPAHPLSALKLAIEICCRHDQHVVSLEPAQPSEDLLRPWGCVKAEMFTLKHQYFLEPPSEPGEDWKDVSLGYPFHDGHEEHKMPKPLMNLRVATGLSNFLSSNKRRYPMMQLRLQAVHTSDLEHYRAEKMDNVSDRQENDPKSREVRVRCNVHKLVRVDLKEHSFDADVFLESSWLDYQFDDQRFADSKTGLEVTDEKEKLSRGRRLLQDLLKDPQRAKRAGVWNPGVHVRNCIKDEKREQWFDVFDDTNAHVIVCHKQQLFGRFVTRFELDDFPVDTQTLELIVGTQVPNQRGKGGDSNDDVTVHQLVLNKNYVSIANDDRDSFPLNKEYKLSRHVHGISELTCPESSSTGTIYPTLRLQIRIRRKIAYFLWCVC